MKKILLLLSLVIVALLLFYYLTDNNRESADIKKKSPNANVAYDSAKVEERQENIEYKVTGNVVFKRLQLFWKKNSPLTDIELSLLSRMPAKDFIEVYRWRAENGDRSADFFISYIKNVCANVAVQKSELNSQRVNRNSLFRLLLDMSSQCDSLYAKPLKSHEVARLHSRKFNKQISFLLGQDISLGDLDGILLKEVPSERSKIYKSLRKEGVTETDIVLYEGMARIDDAASFNAAVEVLSASSVTNSPSERKELAAWLVASCASGYPCDYSQFTMNSFIQFCVHADIECKDKTLKEVVNEYLPDSSYDDILSRSMEISEYVISGQGTRLLETYLEETKE